MAQAKVITETETFKPITLQITLETQGEVNALYELCAVPTFRLSKLVSEYPDAKRCSDSDIHRVTCDIYNTLRPHTK